MLDNLNTDEILFIDIETVPQWPAFGEMPETWQKHWEQKMKYQADENNTPESLFEKAGIFAEFGKIICISAGYIFQKQGEFFFRVKSFYDADEKKLLSGFINALEKFAASGKKRLCAHNGQEFDFPYIARRCLVNELVLPKILDVAGAKPWETKDVLLDTLQLWKFGDYKHYTSLALLCDIFSIPTPKDDIDGSQVAKVYYEEGNIDRIIRYCEKDTLAVANLLLRYKGKKIIPAENMEIV
jgi:3'-5' exonuclease